MSESWRELVALRDVSSLRKRVRAEAVPAELRVQVWPALLGLPASSALRENSPIGTTCDEAELSPSSNSSTRELAHDIEESLFDLPTRFANARALFCDSGEKEPVDLDETPTSSLSEGDSKVQQRRQCLKEVRSHEFELVVAKDVERSFFFPHSEERRSEAECERRRVQLRVVLDAVFAADARIHYVQGIHDVAQVVLLAVMASSTETERSEQRWTLAEEPLVRQAVLVLHALCRVHLRDAVRDSLTAEMTQLHLLKHLLRECDGELGSFLETAGVFQGPPIFVLALHLTWLAHRLSSLKHALRVFDFLLASHPLMALYVVCSTLRHNRSRLLSRPCELHEVHTLLQRDIDTSSDFSLSELLSQSEALYRKVPPTKLLRKAIRDEVRQCPGSTEADPWTRVSALPSCSPALVQCDLSDLWWSQPLQSRVEWSGTSLDDVWDDVARSARKRPLLLASLAVGVVAVVVGLAARSQLSSNFNGLRF